MSPAPASLAPTVALDLTRGLDALDDSFARGIETTPEGVTNIAFLLESIGGVLFGANQTALAASYLVEAYRLVPDKRLVDRFATLRLIEIRPFVATIFILETPFTLPRIAGDALIVLAKTCVELMRDLVRGRPRDTNGALTPALAFLELLFVIPLALLTLIVSIVGVTLFGVSKVATLMVAPLTRFGIVLMRRRALRELSGAGDIDRVRRLAAETRALIEKK